MEDIKTPEEEGRQTTREVATSGRQRADLSLIVSILALAASGLTAWTSHQALDFNKKSAAASQKASLFTQFQLQYLTVASQFPAQVNDPNFRPPRGSDAYARLEAYWLFCFSEWYATRRVNPDAFGNLWTDYYAPLVADGLEIGSLRYVLEDIIATRALDRGQYGEFLAEVARIARADGQPLRPEMEQRLARVRRR